MLPKKKSFQGRITKNQCNKIDNRYSIQDILTHLSILEYQFIYRPQDPFKKMERIYRSHMLSILHPLICGIIKKKRTRSRIWAKT